MPFMTRNAEDDYDALTMINAMESVGATVVALTPPGISTTPGASTARAMGRNYSVQRRPPAHRRAFSSCPGHGSRNIPWRCRPIAGGAPRDSGF